MEWRQPWLVSTFPEDLHDTGEMNLACVVHYACVIVLGTRGGARNVKFDEVERKEVNQRALDFIKNNPSASLTVTVWMENTFRIVQRIVQRMEQT